MPSLPYAVVLLPEPALRAAAIRVSRQLEAAGGRFQLDEDSHWPHLALFMAQLSDEDPDDAVALCVERLRTISARTPSPRLTATRYDQDEPEGFVEVQYEITDPLAQLQKEVIAACAPLRDDLRESDPAGRVLADWIHQAPAEVRENLEHHGYDEAGSLFRPHITFTRLARGAPLLSHDDLPPAPSFSGVFPHLALFHLGPHGTCTRAVAVIDL